MANYKIYEKDQYYVVENEGGATLGFSKTSGVSILEDDGFAFKDLNKNGVLDPYEDWRLPLEERIIDLVQRMSIEEIGGLMLYSAHQSVTTNTSAFAAMFAGTYDGLPLAKSGKHVYELSDQQKKFLDEHLRHVLVTVVDSAEVGAKWNNELQSYVEGLPLGIPVNTSSDPRHTTDANTEFDAGSGGDISKWPQPLGLGATFQPELVRSFGNIAAKEYRAMGITTALSPQIDLASEPRWMRFNGTFGEDSSLTCAMAEAYCDGFQTSANGSWGTTSVNAMVKHWPGGGSGEGGRDAHFGNGKYAVYPNENFNEHLVPFINGAFKLKNGTKKASAVMPYYTISYNQDQKYHENVGNGFSTYIINDLLRDTYGYDGVVCSDWMITKDCTSMDQFIGGKCWGVEQNSEAQRHYKALMAGVDQFGGNNELQPVLDAYEIGVKEQGESFMRKRFEVSAARLLRNIFQCSLFENPYVDPCFANTEVGKPSYMEAGYQAQLQSIVLLKNHKNVLPLRERKNVYIPKRRIAASYDWFGNLIPAREEYPIERSIVQSYYDVVDTASEADFAIVFIESPQSPGYVQGEYFPISLQYRPYCATLARPHSIAQDPHDEVVDRTYLGKTTKTVNEADLDIILETRKAIGNKPVLVSITMNNPTVVKEFEHVVDGILVNFQVQSQAILDIISGKVEPSGLLPFQMPANMETVETQAEDASHDMVVHIDTDGNSYDFAYGLHYHGIINDARVLTYKK